MSYKFLIGAMAAALLAVGSNTSAAADQDTQWQKEHPRREQVNHRLANQDKRIRNEVKEGEITQQQAASLHAEDKQIRQEERDMASQNNGHITKIEQRALNRQEDAVSKQIGK